MLPRRSQAAGEQILERPLLPAAWLNAMDVGMPTVLREGGYRFFFYSDEGHPREPPHVHVVSAEKTAKFWLNPVELATSRRMHAVELGALHAIVRRNNTRFLEQWYAHFDP